MVVDYSRVLEWYSAGGNIIQMLTEQYSDELSKSEIIKIAYDLQAGEYVKKALANPDDERGRAEAFAKVINGLDGIDSMLDAGVGEATSLTAIMKHLNEPPKTVRGFDISLSRLAFARKFTNEHLPFIPEFAVGDMYNAPLLDESCDLVYTVHALEPNGGNEAALLSELYRITGKYLVLFEPSYELGGEKSRQHMDKHNYVKGLLEHARRLGGKVIEYKMLFDSNSKSYNNTAVMVIEKPRKPTADNTSHGRVGWGCPVSNQRLINIKGCYYSPESALAYPVIDGIPILLKEHSVLASYLSKF
jgi:ubiquinone/menaquinone biosynthesis C-methylase UbiE